MQTKRIICPNCNAVLHVKNSQNEEIKQIVCPNCKTPLKVNFSPQYEPLEAKTYIEPSKQAAIDNGATQFTDNNNGVTRLVINAPQKNSTAILMFGGVSYPLEEGQNIVGRKGSTSKATIQIETADRYMSRQHCSIIVTSLPDGSKKVVLCNYQNKNLTIVDGLPIENGDQIRLTDNNSITMGHSTLTFKLS